MNSRRRFAVIGHPVAHSLSPFIHERFAEQFDIELEYGRLDVAPDRFAETVREFFANGGTGLNVTLPHKEHAFSMCEITSPAARLAGAVNTLLPGAKATLIGENTDGVGLRRDLEDNLGFTIRGSKVLVIGAGGAARGILGPLVLRQPQELVIANRTLERACALMHRYAEEASDDDDVGTTPAGVRMRASSLADAGTGFALVLNASSAGHSGVRPGVHADALRNALVYDLQYGEAAQPLLEFAERSGAEATTDGLGLLVEQAAESFFVWNDERPTTAPILAELRKKHAIA